MTTYVTIYIEVADIEKTLTQVEDRGGKTIAVIGRDDGTSADENATPSTAPPADR
jgi:predicted enzyme related to lactoylglutathione lyase